MPFETVLYEMSYVNVIMYSNVIPSYTSKKDDNKEKSKAKSVTPNEFVEFLKTLKK